MVSIAVCNSITIYRPCFFSWLQWPCFTIKWLLQTARSSESTAMCSHDNPWYSYNHQSPWFSFLNATLARAMALPRRSSWCPKGWSTGWEVGGGREAIPTAAVQGPRLVQGAQLRSCLALRPPGSSLRFVSWSLASWMAPTTAHCQQVHCGNRLKWTKIHQIAGLLE